MNTISIKDRLVSPATGRIWIVDTFDQAFGFRLVDAETIGGWENERLYMWFTHDQLVKEGWTKAGG